MKIISKITLVIILSLTLFACNQEKEEIAAAAAEQVVSIIETKSLTNQKMLDKISSRVSSFAKAKNSKSIVSKMNFSQGTISEYEGTDIKGINIPMSDGYSYVTYAKEDKISEEGMLVKISNENSTYFVKYYDLNKSEIGGLTISEGIITDAYGIIIESKEKSYKAAGWWSRWGDCVGASLNKMTDGSVEGSIYGLACIAFGPECAIGVGLGCAAGATFF
jgi:hypothetical protein